MLNKSEGSKLETQTHVHIQSSIHPTPLPFFCECFSQSKNIFSFQKIKCLTGFETAVIALNTLFILNFHTGTFPLSFKDKGRHLWNTFKCVCKMLSTAGVPEVWQVQAGDANTWGSFPCSRCSARCSPASEALNKAWTTKVVLGR